MFASQDVVDVLADARTLSTITAGRAAKVSEIARRSA
jgi:hypothetical protein